MSKRETCVYCDGTGNIDDALDEGLTRVCVNCGGTGEEANAVPFADKNKPPRFYDSIGLKRGGEIGVASVEADGFDPKKAMGVGGHLFTPPFPCVEVPADFEKWNSNGTDGILQFLHETSDGSWCGIGFEGVQPHVGRAELLAGQDRNSMVSLALRVTPGNAEEACRMVLRAAVAAGLVRTTGGDVR